MIAGAGLSFTDCLDKTDLIQRAQQAWNRLHGAPSAAEQQAGSEYPFPVKKLKTKQGEEKIDGVLLILHGFGVSTGSAFFLSFYLT